jgi:predicted flap endonuclease-1-like 5' DNA nuclease
VGYSIEKIEGIGPAYGKKLAEAGIRTTTQLLKAGADRKGRKSLGDATGISDQLILKWTNMADLMRISGIGTQFSELLEAAGVDTVKELRNRNAENLAQKMAEVNAAKHLTRRVPPRSLVEQWVADAKSLPPIMTY